MRTKDRIQHKQFSETKREKEKDKIECKITNLSQTFRLNNVDKDRKNNMGESYTT